MSSVRAPRWALSFADLCLLLLGFFVLMQAQGRDRATLSSSLRAAFGEGGMQESPPRQFVANAMFERGEAVLLEPARVRLVAIGRRAKERGQAVRIESRGVEARSHRFDAWELSAARAAAIARAIRGGGLDDRRIHVAIPPAGEGEGAGQTITLFVMR